jgi:hypothetical protein
VPAATPAPHAALLEVDDSAVPRPRLAHAPHEDEPTVGAAEHVHVGSPLRTVASLGVPATPQQALLLLVSNKRQGKSSRRARTDASSPIANKASLAATATHAAATDRSRIALRPRTRWVHRPVQVVVNRQSAPLLRAAHRTTYEHIGCWDQQSSRESQGCTSRHRWSYCPAHPVCSCQPGTQCTRPRPTSDPPQARTCPRGTLSTKPTDRAPDEQLQQNALTPPTRTDAARSSHGRVGKGTRSTHWQWAT